MDPYVKTTSSSVPSYRAQLQVSGVTAKVDFPFNPSPASEPAWTNTISGEKRPGWRKIVESGGNATTPMQASEVSVRSIPTDLHIYGNVNFPNQPDTGFVRAKYRVSHFTAIPGAMPVSSVDAEAENLARVKASRKIEGIMTAFQGGVFLGELLETLRMIRSPLKGLRGGLSGYLAALKKRRRGSDIVKRKILADTWLEYSFGWLPFLNDLNSARDVLNKRAKQLEKEFQTFKAVGVSEADLGAVSDSFGSGVSTVTWTRLTKRRGIVVYAGAINSKVLNPMVFNADSMGLAPRSFAPTVWELLPWSFLIDYFTNVGDVIQAWSNIGVSLAWGRHTSIKVLETKVSNIRRKAPSLGYVYLDTLVPGEYFAHRKEVSRSLASSIAPPELSFELPGFGTKWLNMAALLASGKRLVRY